jgi:ribose transport system substrate-binding protein
MHRSLRKSLLILAVGLLLLAFGASTLFAGGTTEKKGYKIGLAMHFMRDDYALNCVEAVKAVAAKYPGSTVIATDANANPPKQLADMENLIAQGVDAIIVVPFDEKAILPAIETANKKNIPVIAITYIPNAKVATTVAASGDYENGKATAELLIKKMGGKGKLAVIDLGFSLWRIDQRIEGFMDAIRSTDIEIVARVSGADQADIQNKVAGILAAHPDLNAIWATFSNQIVAASDALRAANRKDVLLSGIDADKAIIERIKEGWITGTAAQFPKEHGRLAAEAAFAVLQGKKVAEKYDVPVGIVTAENADEMSVKIWGK